MTDEEVDRLLAQAVREAEPNELYKYRFAKLVAAAAKREWQGLTNEEIEDIRLEYHYADGAVKVGYERAIEAKLREKNT
jgi:hypothetical protein